MATTVANHTMLIRDGYVTFRIKPKRDEQGVIRIARIHVIPLGDGKRTVTSQIDSFGLTDDSARLLLDDLRAILGEVG